MLMKKLLALFVTASVFSSLIIPKANAEAVYQPEKLPTKEMQVQVMPEFDYPQNWPKGAPSLLVGLYGTITNKTGQDYDGKIEVPVPAKDKGFQVNLVAEFPDDTKPEIQRPFDVDNERGVITWKPQNPIKKGAAYKYVIEYYTQTIAVKDNKSFTYQFAGNTAIDQLNVIFYAPMNAKSIQLEPKAQANEKSDYGEELYYYQYQNVKSGQSLSYQFSYQKDGTESTMEAINKQQPPNDSTHANVNNSTATDQVLNNSKDSGKQPIISTGGAVIIGIAIIIAGVFVYLGLKGNRKAPPAKSNKQAKHQPPQKTMKKEVKTSNTDEKKELRKKLLTGKIDQETYEEEMKKLI